MVELPKARIEEKRSKEDIAKLKESAKEMQKMIDLMEVEKKLRYDILQHQKKYPKVIKANFEFESKDEYSDLLKAQWELDYKKIASQIDGIVKDTKNKIDILNEEIARSR